MTSDNATGAVQDDSTIASGSGPVTSANDPGTEKLAAKAPVPAVIGGWRIESHLGSGHWSEVFLARGALAGVPRRLALQIDGRWLLSDLGLASPPGRESLAAHAGSLSYLAPEYLTAPTATEPAAIKHPPGDIWAFGIVLHRWLTGEFPFPGDNPAQRAQSVIQGAEPRLTVTDPKLRALISAMIARRPGDRPSAWQVAAALRGIAGVPRRRRRPRPLTLVAAALLAVLAWAGGAFSYALLRPLLRSTCVGAMMVRNHYSRAAWPGRRARRPHRHRASRPSLPAVTGSRSLNTPVLVMACQRCRVPSRAVIID